MCVYACVLVLLHMCVRFNTGVRKLKRNGVEVSKMKARDNTRYQVLVSGEHV